MGVARRARELGNVLPSANILHGEGVTAYFSIINQPMSLGEAMMSGAVPVENQVVEVIRLFSVADKMKRSDR